MKFKKCFINNDSCNGKIKEAHILSQSATMKLIKDEGKGGLKVVHVGAKNQEGGYSPQEIGWKKASTYWCYCNDHDDKIFKPIEDGNEFDPSNQEQLFLHALRSFSYSYHKRKLKHSNTDDMMSSMAELIDSISNTLSVDDEDGNFQGSIEERIDLRDHSYDFVRKGMLEMWESKDYSNIKHVVKVAPKRFPFASAGALEARIIDVDQRVGSLIFYKKGSGPLKDPFLILTVLPDEKDRTVIILSALKSDTNAIHLLEKFEKLKQPYTTRAITHLMLTSNKDNTFLNPRLWDFIKEKDLVEGITKVINTPRGLDLLNNPVQLSKIDFFILPFSCESLGISYSRPSRNAIPFSVASSKRFNSLFLNVFFFRYPGLG